MCCCLKIKLAFTKCSQLPRPAGVAVEEAKYNKSKLKQKCSSKIFNPFLNQLIKDKNLKTTMSSIKARSCDNVTLK